MTAVAAAVLAALATWWWLPPGRGSLGRLDAIAPSRVSGPRPAVLVAIVVGALLAVSGLVAGTRGAAVGLAGAVALGTVARLVAGRAARRRAARRRAEVVHAGDLMAGLLRVGRVPSAALAEAAVDAPLLRVASAEHAAGGEAAAALRRASSAPGCAGLAGLADAWEVSTRTGASLVDAVEAAARGLAAEGEVARVVEVELAAARLAGRTLALLPGVGLLLAYALGGDPVAFLTGSPPGWICLNVGVALACAGVLWIEAVAVNAGGR